MSNELSTVAPNAAPFEANQQAIAQYLGLDPKDAKSHAVVAVCERYELDPVLKHVIVIPGGGVYLTRDGLLHIAHRSGQLDGIVVEQDPILDEATGEYVAKVSVYRKDMRFPFTFPGRYPANGSNKKHPQEMALKSAESHALRRAFDVNGMPSIDERKPGDDKLTAPRVSASDFAPAPDVDVDTETGEVIGDES